MRFCKRWRGTNSRAYSLASPFIFIRVDICHFLFLHYIYAAKGNDMKKILHKLVEIIDTTLMVIGVIGLFAILVILMGRVLLALDRAVF